MLIINITLFILFCPLDQVECTNTNIFRKLTHCLMVNMYLPHQLLNSSLYSYSEQC